MNETCAARGDFERACGKRAYSPTASSAFGFLTRRLGTIGVVFSGMAASSGAKSVGDLGDGDDGFPFDLNRFAENGFDGGVRPERLTDLL